MLSEEQRGTIERRLLRERSEAQEALAHFDADAADLRDRTGELSTYRFHPADLGTESQEQEKAHLLASVEGRRLYAVDEALQRLYREPETFDRCERCGREIEFARLELLPQTRLCAGDARAAEAEDGTATAADPREADGNAR